MAKVEVIKNGKVVATAKNLEVLSRYHRKEPVSYSSAKKLANGKGLLKVRFYDGAKAETTFASFDVLKNWLAIKRKRSGWA